MKIGASYEGKFCSFTVWAPFLRNVVLKIEDRSVAMGQTGKGYWNCRLPDAVPGSTYTYELDGVARADPASHYQPDVHGPSILVDHTMFGWEDRYWKPVPLEETVIYEMHIGAL